MAPPKSPPGQADKPAKSDKSDKADKAKPSALPTHVLTEMPPASAQAGRLVAVTDTEGNVLNLAYSNGDEWLSIVLAGPLPGAQEVDGGAA